MQLVQVDLELTDHMGRQRQDQRGDVAAEQAIETSADAVVVEGWQLVVGEPECLGSDTAPPIRQRHRAARGQRSTFLSRSEMPIDGSDPAASIGAWEVRAEKLLETHAFEEFD